MWGVWLISFGSQYGTTYTDRLNYWVMLQKSALSIFTPQLPPDDQVDLPATLAMLIFVVAVALNQGRARSDIDRHPFHRRYHGLVVDHRQVCPALSAGGGPIDRRRPGFCPPAIALAWRGRRAARDGVAGDGGDPRAGDRGRAVRRSRRRRPALRRDLGRLPDSCDDGECRRPVAGNHPAGLRAAESDALSPGAKKQGDGFCHRPAFSSGLRVSTLASCFVAALTCCNGRGQSRRCCSHRACRQC